MKSLSEYISTFQINEMADSLDDFKKTIRDHRLQILQNWCLVRWCDLNPDNDISKRLRSHRTTELKSQMLKIVTSKLKAGKKSKVIKKQWIDRYELDDYNSVADAIRDKFKEEKLGKYVANISFDCAENALEICNILSTNNINDVEEYINGYLG